MVISIGDLEKETEFGPHNIFFFRGFLCLRIEVREKTYDFRSVSLGA